MIYRYTVIKKVSAQPGCMSDDSLKELEKLVNDKLDDSWQLSGGICVVNNNGNTPTAYQAMFKIS
jgi:hypothetical protein